MHCDYFAQRPRSKAVKSAPDLEESERAGGRTENVFVVFTCVEEGDDSSVAKKAAAEIEKNFREVKASTVVVHPYAHLSPCLAKPDAAMRILNELWAEVKKFAPDAKKSPFGWYKEFELKCKGHPLSELSKTIALDGMVGVAGSAALPAKGISPAEVAAKISVAKPELLKFVVPDQEKKDGDETARNTAAFILAAAMHETRAGTVVAGESESADGFFVDFESKKNLSDADLEKISGEIEKIVAKNGAIKISKVAVEEAKRHFLHNKYKSFLLDSAPKDARVYLAQMAGFYDLANGPLFENTGRLAAFKLTKAGGAYWLDDAANVQLKRVSGVAFRSKNELEAYEKMIEEAERRDQRRLGKELKMFKFSDEVGMGLPLWMPRGDTLRHILLEYMRELEERNGYKYVQTPSITKAKIFYTSGHLPHYKDSMYAPIEIEGSEYYLKPMNCPFHHEICKELVTSYRDLPLRIAEPGSCYRYELSGVMYGVIRTRNFTQNDSHIYCTEAQTKEEFVRVLRLFKEVYKVMGVSEYWYRLSLPDFEKNPEKYAAGEDRKRWEWAAQVIRQVMRAEGEKFVEAVGEAAFYGPKIDVQIKNVFGKDDSIATIQIDVLMAKRFNLAYANERGEKELMVIIHRAILGSFERFIAFLLEQYAGSLPAWLSPVQVAVLPITKTQEKYAGDIAEKLKGKNVRVEIDGSDEKIEYKIREAQLQKIPYMLVIGEKEADTKTVSVRTRKGEIRDAVRPEEFEAELLGEIESKKK